MYVGMYVCVCVCINIHIYVCIHTYMYLCVCVYYIHTYTHIQWRRACVDNSAHHVFFTFQFFPSNFTHFILFFLKNDQCCFQLMSILFLTFTYVNYFVFWLQRNNAVASTCEGHQGTKAARSAKFSKVSALVILLCKGPKSVYTDSVSTRWLERIFTRVCFLGNRGML